MLNQNTYTHLADDFKYFDDPNDGYGVKFSKLEKILFNKAITFYLE